MMRYLMILTVLMAACSGEDPTCVMEAPASSFLDLHQMVSDGGWVDDANGAILISRDVVSAQYVEIPISAEAFTVDIFAVGPFADLSMRVVEIQGETAAIIGSEISGGAPFAGHYVPVDGWIARPGSRYVLELAKVGTVAGAVVLSVSVTSGSCSSASAGR